MPLSSPAVRALRGPLVEDARERIEREVNVALKVAVLLWAETPRGQLAERAESTEPEVKAAIATLRRIAPRLEREEDPMPNIF